MQTTSAPLWITIWNMLKTSMGNSPYVTIGLLDIKQHPYLIPIKVNDTQKAVAIASIIKPQHDSNGILTNIHVIDKAGKVIRPIIPQSVNQLAQLTKTALKENGWFKDLVYQSNIQNEPDIVFILFKKAVIQFYNDDAKDLYQNYNNVAAFVFREVLLSQPGGFLLNCSTTLA